MTTYHGKGNTRKSSLKTNKHKKSENVHTTTCICYDIAHDNTDTSYSLFSLKFKAAFFLKFRLKSRGDRENFSEPTL